MTSTALTPLFVSPNPLSPHFVELETPPGSTIADMLTEAVNAGAFGEPEEALEVLDLVRVYIDGEPVPGATPEERMAALDIVPPVGSVVNVQIEPQGGSNSDARNALNFFFQIGAAVVGFFFGPVWGAAVAIAGFVITNVVLFPFEQPNTATDAGNRYALSGQSNQIRKRQMMTLQLAPGRQAGDIAALPYSRTANKEVWLYGIVSWHYGPCSISDIKIGETALASYPASDVRVEHKLLPGPRDFSLYPSVVSQEFFQDELDLGGDWEVHTVSSRATKLEIDLVWPGGLRFTKESGSVLPQETRIKIERRPLDEGGNPIGAWAAPALDGAPHKSRTNAVLPAGTIDVQGKTQDPLYRTISWNEVNPAAEGFEVRVKASDPDNDDATRAVQDVVWTALKAVDSSRNPIVDEYLACTAFAIRSSDDLNNVLPPITAKVTPHAPTWDAVNEVWKDDLADWTPSDNAARNARMLLMGPGAAKPRAPEDIDASCLDAYELIEANNWRGGFALKDFATVEDALNMLGRIGRFGWFDNGEAVCFVPDWDRPIARQLFTGRNVQNYRYTRHFPEPIHGVLIEYLNAEKDGQEDELLVCADGYTEETAEKIETFRLPFECDPTRAFKEGRAWMVRRQLGVETHSWSAGADAEVVAVYGDRVRVRHWSSLYGVGEAYVQHRHMVGGLVTGVRLDSAVVMKEGESYALECRRADKMLFGLEVVTEPGRTRDLYFPLGLAEDDAPQAGDLIAFGETDEITEDLQLLDIDYAAEGGVSLVAGRWLGAELQIAETGEIPPLVSKVAVRPKAPQPQFVGINRATPDGVRVAFAIDDAKGALVETFTGRWRPTPQGDIDTTAWSTIPPLAASARLLDTGPLPEAVMAQGEAGGYFIDLELRSRMRDGEPSPPTFLYGVEVKRGVFSPTSFAAAGVQRIAPDGSSYGAIHVSCDPLEAGIEQDLVVEVQPHGADPEEFRPAGEPLPAANPSGDYRNVNPGGAYDVRGRWRTADNWTSEWVRVNNVVVPPGSNVSNDTVNVGGTPATDVLNTIDEIIGDIEDLEIVFGDTVSAATSAAAAAASAASAVISASQAATSAGDADDAATAAISAATTAATAATAASNSATNAATSATSASGSASSASTSATNAANSATSAGNSATAAAGSASSAATQATNAGNSATAAAASAVSASSSYNSALLVSNMLLPERIVDAAGSNLAGAANGDPATVAGIGTLPTASVANEAGYGYVLTGYTAASSGGVLQRLDKGVVPATAGKVYEVTMEWEIVANPGGQALTPDVRVINNTAAFAANGTNPAFVGTAQSAVGIYTLSYRFSNVAATGILAWTAGTVWIRPSCRVVNVNTPSAATVYIRRLTTRDVTAVVASETQASAAATSASAAATSAGTAGTYATAAQTSATNAATSATNASNSASAASTSATSASNSASTATTQAANASTSASAAATSATSASNSASAAATSASTAATHATDAGNSASAAAASAVSASSAYTDARTAAALLLPARITDATGTMFTASATGSPDSVAVLGSGSIATEAGFGYVATTTAPYLRGVVPAITGRVYEIKLTLSVTVYSSLIRPRMRVQGLDATYAATTSGLMDGTSITAAGTYTVTSRWSSSAATGINAWPAGSTWLRFGGGWPAPDTGTNTLYVRSIAVSDITAVVAAETQASAAATSASSAATSATAAGSSASAASTSATNAATSATNASNSASAASTSATNASNSASTATTQAANASTSASAAATSATNASNSATAASTSASGASTSATNAGNSASAAATSATNASSSYASALQVANLRLPDNFEQSGKHWCAHTGTTSPVTTAASTVDYSNPYAGVVTYPTVAGIGKVMQSAGYAIINPKGYLKLEAGRTYRLTRRYRNTVAGNTGQGGTDDYGTAQIWIYSSAGAWVGGLYGTSIPTPVNGTWYDQVDTFTATALLAAAPTGVYLQPFVTLGSSNSGAGTNQLAVLRFEDITEVTAAGTSATAAATSASQAATSATGAAASATSATTSANTASTQAGNASTSASSASTSAASAATSATAAASSAILSASLSQGAAINKNPTLQDWTGTYPVNWTPTASVTASKYVSAPRYGAWALQLAQATATDDQGIQASASELRALETGQKYLVFEYEVTLTAGALTHAAIRYEGNFVTSGWHTWLLDLGATHGAGTVGQTYRGSKVVSVAGTPAGAYNTGTLGIFTNYSGAAGAASAKTLVVHRLLVRSATTEEISSNTAIPTLQASVSTQAAAIVALQGRTTAYLIQEVNAGSLASAFLALRAETSPGTITSSVSLGAREVHIYNAVGAAWEKVLSATGGIVRVYGDLNVGGAITVGDFRWPVALAPTRVNAYDGQVISYGGSFTTAPMLVPDFSGFPSLTSGQFYVFRAEGNAVSGFTARVKKVTGGTTASAAAVAGAAAGSGPAWQANKGQAADASDGNYTFTFSGNIRRVKTTWIDGDGTTINEISGGLVAQTWFRAAGGAWTAGPTIPVAPPYGTTTATVAYSQTATVQWGTAIGQDAVNTEFGISILSSENPAYDTIGAFAGVTYTYVSGLTEVTATPSNLPLLPILIIPVNSA